MRAVQVALFCAAVLASTAATASDEAVSYRLTPEVHDGAAAALDVEVTLHADRSGRTVIDLPDAGTGRRSRWRFISDLTAEGASMQEDGPAKRVLTSAPGARISLRYRVRSAYDREPDGDDGNPYKGAVILPTWFASLGDYIFVSPEQRDHAPASFQWGPLPRGWVVGSDLDPPSSGAPLTVSDVVNSVMLGGSDVKLLRRPIEGGELTVAIRGAWAFPQERLADDIATVIDVQRRFWGKASGPYFVGVVPLAAGSGVSVGGTGKFQGFALYGTRNADEPMMRRILAHEHTHNWIPFQQGRMPDGAQESRVYWYSEGFTDFYTDRTLLRSGVWKLPDFVQHLNQVLREYDTSPVRTAPNRRIVSDFWTDENVQKLPYERGYLLAFLWDREIRAASRGRSDLDQVMFAMRDRYLAAAPARKTYVVPGFEREIRIVGGVDVRRDVKRFALEGEPIRLPESLFGQCAKVATTTVASFDPGFDMAASAAKGAFTGVDPNGPAYRAGLRDGMTRVQRLGGEPGDSRVEISYRVRDQTGGERVIRYKPEGRTSVSFQQVELSDRARTDPATRIAMMTGRRGAR